MLDSEKLFSRTYSYRLLLEQISAPAFIIDSGYNILFKNRYYNQVDYFDPSAKIKDPCHKFFYQNPIACEGCISGIIPENSVFCQTIETRKESAIIIKGNKVKLTAFLFKIYIENGDYFFIEIIRPLDQKIDRNVMPEENMAGFGLIVKSMAHELSNPLTGLNLTIQSLENILKKDQPNMKQVDKLIQLFKKDLIRASGLINDIRNFTATRNIAAHFLSIESVITSSLETALRMNPEILPKVNWKWEISKNTLVVGIQHQLEQCFINIIKNSLEAFQENQKKNCNYCIDIMLSKCVINKKSMLDIKITDNAGGIPQDKVHLVFTPNFSLKKNGSGLGLYIVQKILYEHNGLVSVNVTGEQTSFNIYLPIN